jgi:hypothetical protein
LGIIFTIAARKSIMAVALGGHTGIIIGGSKHLDKALRGLVEGVNLVLPARGKDLPLVPQPVME